MRVNTNLKRPARPRYLTDPFTVYSIAVPMLVRAFITLFEYLISMAEQFYWRCERGAVLNLQSSAHKKPNWYAQ